MLQLLMMYVWYNIYIYKRNERGTYSKLVNIRKLLRNMYNARAAINSKMHFEIYLHLKIIIKYKIFNLLYT